MVIGVRLADGGGSGAGGRVHCQSDRKGVVARLADFSFYKPSR